jgi:hypothetical protein
MNCQAVTARHNDIITIMIIILTHCNQLQCNYYNHNHHDNVTQHNTTHHSVSQIPYLRVVFITMKSVGLPRQAQDKCKATFSRSTMRL